MMRIISPNHAQKIMNGVLWGVGILAILIMVVIIGYILYNGLPQFSFEFIFGEPVGSGESGGIWPMIVSTFYVTFVALVVATPLGVLAAIWLAEYAGENKLVKAIRFAAETLASIPSIVFGLFGLTFFVVFLQMGFSVLAGGLTLALMAIPTILRTSEVAIETVPQSYKEGSLALGASKWQTIYRVVLPAAIPGITTGIILGMARAIEETAAILYTVGASLAVPLSIWDPARPLPLHLYILATEGISLPNAYGTAAVLVILILIITVFTNYLVERYTKKMMGR
ncbi:MAG TPA: phosphate ABC transporter permease PstA [Methanobacterium sp.]|nr:phosphate ABC transporter permease PstA [Methanobacterium sp.]